MEKPTEEINPIQKDQRFFVPFAPVQFDEVLFFSNGKLFFCGLFKVVNLALAKTKHHKQKNPNRKI